MLSRSRICAHASNTYASTKPMTLCAMHNINQHGICRLHAAVNVDDVKPYRHLRLTLQVRLGVRRGVMSPLEDMVKMQAFLHSKREQVNYLNEAFCCRERGHISIECMHPPQHSLQANCLSGLVCTCDSSTSAGHTYALSSYDGVDVCDVGV